MWEFPKLDRETIFIAAPGDIRYLRSTAAVAEIEQIKARSAAADAIEIYDWIVDKSEGGFDDWVPGRGQIPLPSAPNCRAVICTFGARIGTPLPKSFPLAAIGHHGTARFRCSYGAKLPHDDADPTPNSFAITASVFEYLTMIEAAQRGEGYIPPVLLLFVGDNSIRDDTDLLAANFDGGRLHEEAQRRVKTSELRRCEARSYLPQAAQLRHFIHYVQDQGIVVRIVSDEAAACREIRRFLLDKLGLRLQSDDRNPFKGLESCGVEDAERLYGGGQERRDAIAGVKAVAVKAQRSDLFSGNRACSR